MLRRGNVSATGLFIEVDRALGMPAAMQTLTLCTEDQLRQLDVLTQIARIVTVDDAWRGRAVCGMAYAFCPEDEKKRRDLEELVRHAVQTAVRNDPMTRVDHRLLAVVAEKPLTAAAKSFSLQSMTLETDWPVFEGETIRATLEAPDSRRRFKIAGVAKKTQAIEVPGAMRYRVDVQLNEVSEPTEEPERPASSLDDAFSVLIDRAVFSSEPSRPATEQLSGLLASVSLPSLLTFFDLERVSGVLSVHTPEHAARLYFQDGRVIDLELDGRPGDARGSLAVLLTQNEGSFEFKKEAVSREDRVHAPTSALLLDIMREMDESSALRR